MVVAIGTTNPSKIIPVEQVFHHYFEGIDVKAVAIKVDSGVRYLPMDADEMYQGAINRAKKAREKVQNADYTIGIEGGFHKYPFGWVKKEVIVIVDKKGKEGVGVTGGVMVPDAIMKRVEKGQDLRDAIFDLYNIRDAGLNSGVVGIVTKSYVIRSEALRHGIAFALSPFLHEQKE
ncbi:MAG TPA: inosine/xanthosine triphosphatase [Patescibacteria group bacterium]|nr:inosine/xanthosine triphosphatase [Patescibacteria group bacterium]